jgi:hypothetical protein
MLDRHEVFGLVPHRRCRQGLIRLPARFRRRHSRLLRSGRNCLVACAENIRDVRFLAVVDLD